MFLRAGLGGIIWYESELISNWLPVRDSNPNYLIQSQASYH